MKTKTTTNVINLSYVTKADLRSRVSQLVEFNSTVAYTGRSPSGMWTATIRTPKN